MTNIAHYTCRRTAPGLEIDGNLDKQAWAAAEKSAPFVDMVSGAKAWYDTRIAALYDDEKLYLAYWVEEPSVEATLTERDSLIFLDNDVEVFIDGDECYYELEINAFNTIYEVFFAYHETLKPGSRLYKRPEFDLYNHDVDVLSGFQDGMRYKKSPRGKRWAFMDWDFPGLETAVRIDGTINDPGSLDRGWTVEIALPWKGFETLYGDTRRFPPRPGDELRIQFFRFENITINGKPSGQSQGWALNSHGVYDSHLPDRFACLHFE
jgi:hypothetical protein